ILLLEVDDAVRELDDRALRGTGDHAAPLRAVHAHVLAHEHHDARSVGRGFEGGRGERIAVRVDGKFVELDEVPERRRHVRDRLVRMARPLPALGLDVEVVPLDARHLARLAADAGGRVDEHADLVVLADGGPRPGGRDVLDLERAAHYAGPTFSSLTRKVLYSGVWELG